MIKLLIQMKLLFLMNIRELMKFIINMDLKNLTGEFLLIFVKYIKDADLLSEHLMILIINKRFFILKMAKRRLIFLKIIS